MSNKKAAHHILLEKWSSQNQELKDKIIRKHGNSLQWIKENGTNLAVGGLGGLLMLTSSGPTSMPINHKTFAQAPVNTSLDKKTFLITDLSGALPKTVEPLTLSQETQVQEILSRDFRLNVKAELDGKRLNRTYGLIGAEQHLARFPGDNINIHFDTMEDARQFTSSGMAPGLGAWGYFAPSQSQMTEEDNLREKYYIAVQTFLSEDFSSRFAEYRDFYKYRKMLVVNPNNGRAVVADIADAGPSPWTGKHLGGSPEVMKYLQRVDGAGKGPVLYFFIDDKANKVPLGPIDIVK